MAASNLNLGKASGGVLNIQPADGTTTTSLVLPAINGTVVAADSNGNVGIGVTPYAWNSAAKAIDIGTSTFGSVYGVLYANNNAYINSAGNYIYKNTGAATQYQQNAGQHQWLIAPSGTAGNAVTWTQAMTLDTSGNLSVGNSTLYRSMQSGQNPLSEGAVILQLHQPLTSNTCFYIVNGAGPSVASTGMGIARHSTTLRSINAAGTINAAGADYAEYEYSNDINLVKGQIVGFKEDGTLTDKYSESIRFAIKSTNPSIVGGDVWGCENIVGIRPEKPVRKLDITEQKLIKDAVLGDDETILEDAVYETVIIEKGDSDKEWKLIYSTYEKDLADFEARLEAERQKVDRIAYAGKVPVNVYGAIAGQYVIAIEKEDGTIDGKLVNKVDMTFTEYQDAVGRVNKILDDGRAEVAVIIH